MDWVPDKKALTRSLLFVLDGVALWFLAILAAAYSARSELPWGTMNAFIGSATFYTLDWIYSPGVTGFELIMYGGFFLIGFGPLWYLIGKPVTSKFSSRIPYIDTEEADDSSTFEAIASEFNRRRP